MLDTGILGMVVHPRRHTDVQNWCDRALLQHQVLVPEIADYELRRKLLHGGLTRSIANLDRLEVDL
ncbi:MAG: nucleic acid-binding protein, partial [Planctomycetes bacterium]|nr:nucleic acid-binding protein [Planctomycetota bacterium]